MVVDYGTANRVEQPRIRILLVSSCHCVIKRFQLTSVLYVMSIRGDSSRLELLTDIPCLVPRMRRVLRDSCHGAHFGSEGHRPKD